MQNIYPPGVKVRIRNSELLLGWGEVLTSCAETEQATVRFYRSPVDWEDRTFWSQDLLREPLADQTRCYYRADDARLVGRVQLQLSPEGDYHRYRIQFPDENIIELNEDEFNVRSYLGVSNPVHVLQSLFHETPFLFEYRQKFVQEYLWQQNMSQGLSGLFSSRIELMAHQVEVIRRVLQDPTVRYLFGDEVGLGKTIEAGAVLRQIRLDFPQAAIGIFVPEALQEQWVAELWDRFQLSDIEIQPHRALYSGDAAAYDVLVIDEAHHVVTGDERFEHVTRLAHRTPHVLLLSATPVLHHDRELLAMLNLLAPDTYQLEELDLFRSNQAKRQEIGRSLLALSNARLPAFIKVHSKALANLLPDDAEVLRAAENIQSNSGDALREAAGLQMHVTETYRIHRRLLKTRRAVLLDQSLMLQHRTLPTAEFVEEEDEFTDLWQALEEWRIQAAGETAGLPEDTLQSWAATYIQLATALAFDPHRLQELLTGRQSSGEDFEQEALTAILNLLDPAELESNRAGWLDDILEDLEARSNTIEGAQHVVFATHAAKCDSYRRIIAERSPGRVLITAHAGQSAEMQAETVNEFRAGEFRFLIVDQHYEEGQNFEFAKGLVMGDLPWNAMRLEQRLGRLDRIDRVCGPLDSRVLLTTDDSSIAFDTAWYLLLRDGFGLFEHSVSDLAFLIEQQMSQLAVTAFQEGPAGLVRSVEHVKQQVSEERQRAAEQDVIDGLFVGELEATPTYRSLKQADRRASEFQAALSDYAKKVLRIRAHRDGVHIRFDLERNPPLIPVDRLQGFRGIINHRATSSRIHATHGKNCELYLPGHPLVEGMWDIAEWDDRGRAFAMWRKLPGQLNPFMVFRAVVRSELNWDVIAGQLEQSEWTALSKSNLLRLVASWFPAQLHEFFLNADGQPVSPQLQAHCQTTYNGSHDINLGKHKANYLLQLTGSETWPRLCQQAERTAVDWTKTSESMVQMQQAALTSCQNHFSMMLTRLRSRRRREVEIADTEREILVQEELAELIARLIDSPRLWIDAIGLYVLSNQFELPE